MIETMDVKRKFLPKEFEPGCHDVLIGRGKVCYNHIGNKNFNAIVATKLDEYSAATRIEKSKILASIVVEIKKRSENGGFFKKDSNSGLWFEIEEFLAREKASQVFRDMLHKSYRSSSSSKKKLRKVVGGTTRLNEMIVMPQQMLIQPTPIFTKSSITILEFVKKSQQRECIKTFDDAVDEIHSLENIDINLWDFRMESGDNNSNFFQMEDEKDADVMSTCSSLVFKDEKDVLEDFAYDSNSLLQDNIFEDDNSKNFYDIDLADFYVTKAQSFFDVSKMSKCMSITKERSTYYKEKGRPTWTPTRKSSAARTA